MKPYLPLYVERIAIFSSGLLEKRLKVVTEITSMPADPLIGINSFGFGGANIHVILRSAAHVQDLSSGFLKPALNLLTSRTQEGLAGKC